MRVGRWASSKSFDAAEAACRRLVDAFLIEAFEPGMNAAALLSSYKSFGEDPFIIAEAELPRPFSAWDYAQKRAAEICGGGLV